MDRWQLWVIEWVLVFTLPKLVIIPAIKWMIDAVRATERQDEIDRLWLEEQEERRRRADGGSWGGGSRRPRVRDDGRPHQPRRPRRPGGGTAAVRAMDRRARAARELRGRPLGPRRASQ